MDEQLTGAVQECGYLPSFNQPILSDHRGVYVDVDITWFFGSDTIPIQPMALRNYTTKNIHQTAQFITTQAQHLSDHRWYQQVIKIQQCIKTNTPHHELVEKADKRRIEACQYYAGKRLKNYGPIPYSPELMKMKTVDKILTMIIRRMNNQDEDQETMHNLQQK
jgi:hypothetical protein